MKKSGGRSSKHCHKRQKKNQPPPAAPVHKPMESAELIRWLGCGHGRLAIYTLDIWRNTVKIKSDLKDPEKYSLTFTYSADRAGRITIRLLQLVGHPIQEKFTITKDFKEGSDQKFIHDGISFPSYDYGYTKVYHLVIEAQATEDGIENNILETTLASVEKVSGETIVTVNNQILSANGRKSVCHDMDGVKYSTQSDEDDPYNGCCICFNKENPGILFPIGKLKLIEKPIVEEIIGNRVYKGTYDKSPVIAERIPKGHGTDEMIQILKKSNPHHSNILWCIAEEENEDFVFFVYESCECTLHDLITGKYELKCLDGFTDLKLWKPDGFSPSECLFKLMRSIVEGIVCLIELGIIPNLNPRMIFIQEGTSSLTAKVLGMGISSTGQTTAWDSLDLGKLFVFCFTSDYLPFDLEDVKDHLKRIPEAYDLISRLQHHHPESRPTARDVCNDILFWDSEFILSFYQETSAIIKSKKCDPGLRKALLQIKDYDNWDQVLDKALVEDIKHHAKNITADLCGLIQGIRNKYTHRDEFNKPLKSLFGEDTTGLEAYFRYKFPRLLMDVYKVMKEHCVRGPFRQKYFGE